MYKLSDGPFKILFSLKLQLRLLVRSFEWLQLSIITCKMIAKRILSNVYLRNRAQKILLFLLYLHRVLQNLGPIFQNRLFLEIWITKKFNPLGIEWTGSNFLGTFLMGPIFQKLRKKWQASRWFQTLGPIFQNRLWALFFRNTLYIHPGIHSKKKQCI